MEIVKKSRSLSKYEYFQILQLEWIVADLRFRIYHNEKDKEYWDKVKEGKRVKIEDIGEVNRLPTIFSDQEMLADLQRKIYRTKGHPNFLYKDEKDREIQEPLDLLNYYRAGIDVRYEIDDEVIVGKIKAYLVYAPTITVIDHKTSTERRLSTAEVVRII